MLMNVVLEFPVFLLFQAQRRQRVRSESGSRDTACDVRGNSSEAADQQTMRSRNFDSNSSTRSMQLT